MGKIYSREYMVSQLLAETEGESMTIQLAKQNRLESMDYIDLIIEFEGG